MTCDHCGAAQTIKAHLIPRVFCKQVQIGKSHAAQILENGEFQISQSGIWDSGILCAACDGILGEYENYAHKVSSAIREKGSDVPGKIKLVNSIDTTMVLRFCSAVLYKFSITLKQNGQISLGRYKELLRNFLFDPSSSIPSELDAFIIRPLRCKDDDGVFAYRAPKLDRKYGVNLYRMMMGGIIFFVKVDRKSITNEDIAFLLMKGKPDLLYLTAPAVAFEEFKIPMALSKNNQRLSKYLDRNS